MTQPQFQAWVDNLFSLLEQRAAGLPYVGTIIVQELQAADTAVDANMDAIYSHLAAAEMLTVQVVFDAFRAFLPQFTTILNIVQGLIDASLSGTLTSALK